MLVVGNRPVSSELVMVEVRKLSVGGKQTVGLCTVGQKTRPDRRSDFLTKPYLD